MYYKRAKRFYPEKLFSETTKFHKSMNVNQCSYCGVSSFMEGDVCASCQEALGQTFTAAPETSNENPFETAAFFQNDQSFPQPSANESFPQPVEHLAPAETQPEFLPETSLPPKRPSTADWKRCPICNAGIAQYRDVCSRCAVTPAKQKSGFGKVVFTLLLIGLIGGGVYYAMGGASFAILRKFEKATGSNGSFATESFVMKGSSKVAIQQILSAQEVAFSGRKPVRKEEAYLFNFSYKNPNKSLMDFYKMNGGSHDSAMSQGFNGTSGWKYAKIFDQPAKLEDSGNGFSEGNIGLGVGEYQALSELDDLTKTEFGNAMGYFKDLIKTFEVEGATKNSTNKAFLVSKKTKPDGKTEKTLLVFDEESGFMLGMAKYDLLENKSVSTIGIFTKYKKFWVKEKGFLGTKNKFVSIPTAWNFKIGELEALSLTGAGSFKVEIELEIDSITMDAPIDDAIFEKPSGK